MAGNFKVEVPLYFYSKPKFNGHPLDKSLQFYRKFSPSDNEVAKRVMSSQASVSHSVDKGGGSQIPSRGWVCPGG